jgi:hypothetical protein
MFTARIGQSAQVTVSDRRHSGLLAHRRAVDLDETRADLSGRQFPSH